MTCRECKFWSEDTDKGGDIGDCHAHPPLPVLIPDEEYGDSIIAMYPRTADTDWCGTFKSKTVVPGMLC